MVIRLKQSIIVIIVKDNDADDLGREEHGG